MNNSHFKLHVIFVHEVCRTWKFFQNTHLAYGTCLSFSNNSVNFDGSVVFVDSSVQITYFV